MRPPLDLAALFAAAPSRFVTGLAELLERRVTLILEGSVPRVTGPAYDPLRYSWRRAQSTAAYPLALREAPTVHDVRTCENCRLELPTYVRVCTRCHHALGFGGVQ